MRSHIRPCGAQYLIAFACGLSALAILVIDARAVVQTTGNVWLSPDAGTATYTGLYADDPFTTALNEGIPVNGNRIDPFQSPTGQTEFEGREVGATNVNFSVIVGSTSFGEMIINQSQLRDMDLVIGDQGTTVPIRRGSGVVRIEGFGSLYNNDPTILPYLGPSVPANTSPSQTPRPVDVGYDLYVGRYGNGVLQLALGGRAEIQDAAIVGDQSGSVGTLLIDGTDSFLQSGGFVTDPNPGDVNYMIVGRLGSGTMSILNGGQSFNIGPTLSNDSAVFGAVVGSNLAADNSSAPSDGGSGTVYVDGAASKWTVGGNLQVGGFHDNRTGVGPLSTEDLEGNLADYGSGVGHGTLNVSNGALVSIVPPPLNADASNVPNRLDLLVGYFGTIDLDTGGRIELLGAFNSSDPQNPTQNLSRGRLINDGVVGGEGSISVLQFRNRVLGRVRVDADEKLLISATATYGEIDNIPLPDEEEYPLSNYGTIDVLGTQNAPAEIEIDRNVVPIGQVTATNFTRPFLNLPIPAVEPVAPNGRTEGLIHGEYSTMRFNSGLWNRGVLAWTKGNNTVSGDVISFADSAPGANDHGRVLIGPDTNVAFEDDFFTFGTTQISPGATFQVLKGNSFAVGGTYSMSVTATANGLVLDSPSPLITGNASFSGDLQVSISGGFNLTDPVAIPIFNVGGTITGNFSKVTPSGLPFGSDIDLFTFVFGNQLYLGAFNVPAGDGSGDLNGDGVVDSLDYAIWVQNFGTAGPAGDANGDGIVDARDYNVWRDRCCGPVVPGSGSGGIAGGIGGGAAVPEPTSALLLACGSMLAFTCGRRRSA